MSRSPQARLFLVREIYGGLQHESEDGLAAICHRTGRRDGRNIHRCANAARCWLRNRLGDRIFSVGRGKCDGLLIVRVRSAVRLRQDRIVHGRRSGLRDRATGQRCQKEGGKEELVHSARLHPTMPLEKCDKWLT